MKYPIIIASALIWGWTGWGAHKYLNYSFSPNDVSDVINAQPALGSKYIIVGGKLDLGFERKYIYPVDSEGPSYGSTIYLEFNEPFDNIFRWIPISGESIVYGKLSPMGRYGNLGMHNVKLEQAKVLAWPLPYAILLFSVVHLVPSLFFNRLLMRRRLKSIVFDS